MALLKCIAFLLVLVSICHTQDKKKITCQRHGENEKIYEECMQEKEPDCDMNSFGPGSVCSSNEVQSHARICYATRKGILDENGEYVREAAFREFSIDTYDEVRGELTEIEKTCTQEQSEGKEIVLCFGKGLLEVCNYFGHKDTHNKAT